MPTVEFSWLAELHAVRNNATRAGVNRFRRELRSRSIQGFELELVGRWLANLDAIEDLRTIRIGILSDQSTQPLANAIRVAALREGLLAQIYEAPFGSIHQEVLMEHSGLRTFRPEFVVLALGAEWLTHVPSGPLQDEKVEQALNADLGNFQSLWEGLGQSLGVPIVQHSLVVPPSMLTGPAESGALWSEHCYITALNKRLRESAPAAVHWLDLARLAAKVGLSNWHDLRLKHHAKFSFAIRFLPEYATWFGATLREVIGAAPKALVVDLDNTLWGGVIGDDGLDGITLGPGCAEGEAYKAFCEYIKALGRRGVILGICSKNELKIAEEVFSGHAYMPLRLSDFASVRCNWEDKASNLRDIAHELNIDISSIVFLDDNPAECERVAQELPTVRVVQMHGDPSGFVQILDSLCLFHSQRFSREDLQRTDSYQARARSLEVRRAARDLSSYLTSLEMKGSVETVAPVHLPRLAQMEMKTNQFNLSTRRLSHEQLQSMSESSNRTLLAISLRDRFADHGLVAYLAAESAGEIMTVTDWVMSCRVFSRTLEEYTFRQLISVAKDRGIKRIQLKYSPTNKNGVMVASLVSVALKCIGEYPFGPWVHNLEVDSEPLTFVS
jgi:FkbH-like protein